MYILATGQVWTSKNITHGNPYIVIGGIKLAGSEETPKRICTDRIIGTR
jgi:hypothetical protein